MAKPLGLSFDRKQTATLMYSRRILCFTGFPMMKTLLGAVALAIAFAAPAAQARTAKHPSSHHTASSVQAKAAGSKKATKAKHKKKTAKKAHRKAA